MRFQGKLTRDGKWWLAEVPMFAAATQGRSRKEALVMVVDWFASMVGCRNFSVTIHAVGDNTFEVASDDTRALISLLLRRQRQESGLTLAEAAERLSARSRNAYARYEQGLSTPTIEKLEELLRAIAPDREIVLGHSDAA